MIRLFTQKNIKRNTKNKGFTLVETIVAVGLFVAVFMAISSSFLSIVGAYRKITSERVNVDSLGTAIESMVRGIKTGITYHCGMAGTISSPRDCASGDTYFSFRATNPTMQIVYTFTGGKLQRSDDGGVSFYPVTENTSMLQITDVKFYVFGTTVFPDIEQPRVIVAIKGTSGLGASASTFSVQTTIVQRLPDIPYD